MLEFKTAAKGKKKTDAPEPLHFKIDGEEYVAFPPKDSALALLVASGASDDPSEQMHELLQFFRSTLDEKSMTRFVARLRDKNDDFSLVDATNILQGLIEEFGGRPTE